MKGGNGAHECPTHLSIYPVSSIILLIYHRFFLLLSLHIHIVPYQTIHKRPLLGEFPGVDHVVLGGFRVIGELHDDELVLIVAAIEKNGFLRQTVSPVWR
ncbi:hypothetical protein VNO78_19713 [Psophocarpus tetragonolobus]|uniref:Uncharacterized protein n=1 Tax=Psophocarpus tetragonolobus TaxID=3891 RepID=A0AAN9XGF1_PSOTE